jgi:arylsulfatase
MAYSFDEAQAADRHQTQYFEIVGNRGIYHKGWTAVTKHRTPWLTGAIQTIPFDDDIWELYAPDDWTQAHNLAKEMPDKLHDLQRLWLIEAVKHNVVPLDDRLSERFNPDIAGRPQLVRGHRSLLFAGMKGMSPHSVVPITNKTHAVTAEVVVPEAGAEGVIFAWGGITGGFSLYAKGGKPSTATTSAGCSTFSSRGTGRSLPARTRCGWSSYMTAAAWPRAVPFRSSSMVKRSVRAVSR